MSVSAEMLVGMPKMRACQLGMPMLTLKYNGKHTCTGLYPAVAYTSQTFIVARVKLFGLVHAYQDDSTVTARTATRVVAGRHGGAATQGVAVHVPWLGTRHGSLTSFNLIYVPMDTDEHIMSAK